jgi:hypothetical protein
MAVGFGFLPENTPVKESVQWAWDQFRRSSDAEALDPEAQAISNLNQWIAEGWDVTIKKVDADTGINNREAAAWYDDDAVYIPKDRIGEATGNVLKERELGKALNNRKLLARKPEGDRYVIRWIPKVGGVSCFALSRRAFGRSTLMHDPDNFAVV